MTNIPDRLREVAHYSLGKGVGTPRINEAHDLLLVAALHMEDLERERDEYRQAYESACYELARRAA